MSQKSSPLEREGLLKRVVQYQALAFPKGIGTGQALRERHQDTALAAVTLLTGMGQNITLSLPPNTNVWHWSTQAE